MMNKIVIDNNRILLKKNLTYYLSIEKDVTIDILVSNDIKAKIVIVSQYNNNINIYLSRNSFLLINSLNKDNNSNINIQLEENSKIVYNYSVLSNKDSQNEFCVKHMANNSVSILNNYGINRNDGKLYFKIDGVIPKNLNKIVCNQNSRIINFNNGDSKIIPDLIIDSNDIIANHAAYVGEIDEHEKFYLASRGISDMEIEKLMYRATLLGKMELIEEEEEFNNLINEWW